jgi:hypothetical protein
VGSLVVTSSFLQAKTSRTAIAAKAKSNFLMLNLVFK